jgi:digeranylgeranylglycerophospholipid reductase
MLRAQQLVPRVPPRLLGAGLRRMQSRSFLDWAFGHYLEIAPPEFVAAGPPPALERRQAERAAA